MSELKYYDESVGKSKKLNDDSVVKYENYNLITNQTTESYCIFYYYLLCHFPISNFIYK